MFDTTAQQEQQQCPVYSDIHAQRPSTVIGQRDGRLIADLDAYRALASPARR